MEIERIRHATRALIGEEQNVDYITEELLSELERDGRELIGVNERERVYNATRIVDAVRYVAFYDGNMPTWIEKPISISRSEGDEQGHARFTIAPLSRVTSP